MEAERRMQDITENNTMMFKEELHNIHGERGVQHMQQQQVINDLLLQMQAPYGPIRSDTQPKPLFPQDPVLQQHVRAVETSQQSRQAPASSSNNDPESSHEPKGPVGRPRNDHGVPTETRKGPFYLQSQPLELIRTQLSNRGWGTLHFKHYTQKGTCKTINKITLVERTVLFIR